MWFNIIKDEDEITPEELGEFEESWSEFLQNPPDYEYDELVNNEFVNFDFGDVDNKAWKTVGEEPKGDYTVAEKINFIKKALLSYDFIERYNVGSGPEKLQLSVSQTSKEGFTVRVDRNVPTMLSQMKNFDFNLTDKTQLVVNTVLRHHLKPNPELRARELLSVIINKPEVDARIEGDYVIVKGKPSNRIYKIPLDFKGATCGVISSLPWYRRPREKAQVVPGLSDDMKNVTFEDLVSDEVDVYLCFSFPKKWSLLPTGDKLGSLVLSLQDEEESRKEINVLDAFLKVDEVPDVWFAYTNDYSGTDNPSGRVSIDHVSAAEFLSEGYVHPFDW